MRTRSAISIHAPHEGERRGAHSGRRRVRNHFNPRSPRGGATRKVRMPRRGNRSISIHAPHEGERLFLHCVSSLHFVFQSTLPTRGSDLGRSFRRAQIGYFNPRSPRGGATLFNERAQTAPQISIHAPHEGERRGLTNDNVSIHGDFNPRSPRGGATVKRRIFSGVVCISIHAPHEGERRSALRYRHRRTEISIHAPHEGERRVKFYDQRFPFRFQSTLPTRGSDPLEGDTQSSPAGISIHAPHEGERLDRKRG